MDGLIQRLSVELAALFGLSITAVSWLGHCLWCCLWHWMYALIALYTHSLHSFPPNLVHIHAESRIIYAAFTTTLVIPTLTISQIQRHYCYST